MSSSLPAIASKLATALRNTPCTCIEVGSWPLFKSDTKAHKPRICARCAPLAEYDAFIRARPEQAREALRAAADVPGGRHD